MTKLFLAMAIGAALGVATQQASAASLMSAPFGTTPDGHAIRQYTMTTSHGLEVSFMTFGGVITKIMLPDRQGRMANIVLGFPTLAEYVAKSRKDGVFFGALIGRYANRIANGRYAIDGHAYTTPVNDGPNSLHGGVDGFDRRVWTAHEVARSGHMVAVRLSLVSPDGDQGYPGALSVNVTYSLGDDGAFGIDYTATTTRPTVLNLTNHAYFNLAGMGSQNGILDQMLQIDADRFTPTNAVLIPTGELAPVAHTPFDFTTAKPIGRDLRVAHQQLLFAHGYDHNWVLNGTRDADGLSRAATIWDPGSGRMMTVSTSEPGVQVYTSNFLIGTIEGGGHIFRQSDAVTFETQHFPDSPNQPSFPTTRLDPGHTFHSRTVFHFGLHDAGAAP